MDFTSGPQWEPLRSLPLTVSHCLCHDLFYYLTSFFLHCLFFTFFPKLITPDATYLTAVTDNKIFLSLSLPWCRPCWWEWVSMVTLTKPTVALTQVLCAGEKCWCQGESVYARQQRGSLHLNKAEGSFIIMASSVDRAGLFTVFTLWAKWGGNNVCVCMCFLWWCRPWLGIKSWLWIKTGPSTRISKIIRDGAGTPCYIYCKTYPAAC